MDTLPISNLPTPPAATGAEGTADAATAADAPTDGAFQALLSRNIAGLAQGTADAAAAVPVAPAEDTGAAVDDAALVIAAEGMLSASESALALLAALPQQAIHAESAAPGAGGGNGIRTAISAAIGTGIDDRAGGNAAIPDGRRGSAAVPGRATGPSRPADAGSLRAADMEKPGELSLPSGQPIAEINSTGPQQQTVHAAAQAAWSPAAAATADSAAAAPGGGTPSRIDTPLGAPGWSTALADRLVMFANDKQQIAELHINPPHLGPVDITLTVSDGEASAVFASPHAIVRETIETALPRLREVLAESGINLGQASVTADSPRDGSAQAQSRSSFRTGGERAGSDITQGAAASRATVGSRLSGLVDLFA